MNSCHFTAWLKVLLVLILHHQIVESGQETVDTVDSSVVPFRIQFRRTDKEFIHTQAVTAIALYQIIRADDISLGLRHLDAVFAGDHALVEELGKRLIKIDNSDIMQELCPETRIQQMKNRMLNAADIHVNRQVLVSLFSGDKLFVIVRIHIAQEIPGGAGPLRHGVRLSLGCLSALRAGAVYPIVHVCER